MDESDHQINFNSLKKYVTSLPAAITIMDEFDHQINFNSLKKSATSLSAATETLGSPLGPVTPQVSKSHDYVNHMFMRP
jgi:gamma-glutamylcysteine synthetase